MDKSKKEIAGFKAEVPLVEALEEVKQEPTARVLDFEQFDIDSFVPPPTVTQPKKEEVVLSLTDKLKLFLKGQLGYIKVNDFLATEMKYTADNQYDNKQIKVRLQELIDRGEIDVKDNAHLKLGKAYYDQDQRQVHFTVKNTAIEAKLA